MSPNESESATPYDGPEDLLAILEAVADGIVVVDNKGMIVHYNQKFIKLWDAPSAVLEMCADENQILEFLIAHLKQPSHFQN